MEKITRYLFVLIFFGVCNASIADVLPEKSSEYRQLKEMGFKIKKPEKGDEWTVAEMEDGFTLNVSKSGDLLTLMRSFSRKAINPQEEYQLLKLVNKMNNQLIYQVSIGDGVFIFSSHLFGPYNHDVLFNQIRAMDAIPKVMTDYPELKSLVWGR